MIVIIPFIGNNIDIFIYLILLETAGDSQIDIYLYCIDIIHIHTPTFLHLHFLSSHWAVPFGFAK